MPRGVEQASRRHRVQPRWSAPGRATDPQARIDPDGESRHRGGWGVHQHTFDELCPDVGGAFFKPSQLGEVNQHLREHDVVTVAEIRSIMASAAGRISAPARAKSLSHPPIIVLSTSTSQLSTPGCASTNRLARVDLPLPGGPLRWIRRLMPVHPRACLHARRPCEAYTRTSAGAESAPGPSASKRRKDAPCQASPEGPYGGWQCVCAL